MLNLSTSDLNILAKLNMLQTTDPFEIVNAIADYFYNRKMYREGFCFIKRNSKFASPYEYISYMIYFNEYNISVSPEYTHVIFDILKCKYKNITDVIIPIKVNKNICSSKCTDIICTHRYCRYHKLFSNDKSLEEILKMAYDIFCDGPFDYKKLLQNFEEYERIEILKKILKKYNVPELQQILQKIINERKKNKLDIIRYVLCQEPINIRYLYEISEYKVIT